jgi:hypothetical protein
MAQSVLSVVVWSARRFYSVILLPPRSVIINKSDIQFYPSNKRLTWLVQSTFKERRWYVFACLKVAKADTHQAVELLRAKFDALTER